LNATVSATTASVNQNFTINGTLNATGGAPVAGATITLQNSTNNATWNNVTTTATDANGSYQFSNNESAAGIYYYRSTYAGNATYANATSNVVNVTVSKTLTTALNAAAPATANATQNFTVSGNLTSGGQPLAGQSVTLQRSTDNKTWTNVTPPMANTTNGTGGYAFSRNESAAGTYYYRTAYAGNATYANATSNVVTVNVTSVTKMATTLSLTASNTTPAVNQQVTFTATLKNGTTPLSGKNVTIYHTLNGIRYNDTTKVTNATGQITLTTSWTPAGTRSYYATFAGDSSYLTSSSKVVTITVSVGQTQIILTASNTTPAVNQQVTFTATLKNGTTPLSGKNVTIYHTLYGIRYNDTTKVTNATGQITLTTSWTPAGTRSYYATFAGDSSYLTSTSKVVTITVH
jgi:hypothetical protein